MLSFLENVKKQLSDKADKALPNELIDQKPQEALSDASQSAMWRAVCYD